MLWLKDDPVEHTNYPETVNLPFNFSSLKSDLKFCAPGENLPTEEGYWVILQGGNAILEVTTSGPQLPYGTLPDWLLPQQPALCIGTWRGRPLLAISISSSLEIAPPLLAASFNSADELMDIQTLSLSGLAKQILHWEKQSRYCSRCGAETAPITGSWGKCCSSCNSEHFPHIHPCAIIMVKRGNELLLTRKAEWTVGRYSLVAGFLDFGESLEECAIREVREETGIEICNIRYVGSQNWPFPAQLMAGFVADYASERSASIRRNWKTPAGFRQTPSPTCRPPAVLRAGLLTTSNSFTGTSFEALATVLQAKKSLKLDHYTTAHSLRYTVQIV